MCCECCCLTTRLQDRCSSIGQPVFIPLPTGGYQRLLAACSAFSPVKVAGLVIVGSLLWQSRRRREKRRVLVRLVKTAALRFVDRVDGLQSGNVCCPGMGMRFGYEGVQYQRKGGQFVEPPFGVEAARESPCV